MKLNKDDKTLHEIASLVEYAFLKRNSVVNDPNFLSRYEHSDGYGEFHDGELKSYVMANKFESMIFNAPVKMAGVGYVSSYPENRGRGDISRIMEEILNDCYKNDVPLSNLAPFSESFYRQYGYENAIYQKIISFAGASLRFFKPIKDGQILRAKADDEQILSLVKQVYNRAINSGDEKNTIVRAKWWWERLKTYYPDRFVAVYLDEQSQPRAYMFYKFEQDNFVVDEFFYENSLATKALLSYMGSHAASFKQFKIAMPEGSTLEELFPEIHTLKISLEPYMMSRIIDFGKILSIVKIKSPFSSVKLEVTGDNYCQWNNGVWKIHNNLDQPNTIEKSTNAALMDYSADIRTWTKILLGHLSLEQGIELGLVEKYTDKEIHFASGKVSFYDYF